jgi:23S rRNA (pseudouridine1915-N3)-methyltransferase
LITVGKAPGWIDEGFSHYAGRLPPGAGLELTLVTPRRGQSDAQRLLAAVRPRETTVIFDRRGEPVSSEGLARALADWRMAGRDVALLIGGANGFDDAARRRAQAVLSLSAMTFPHQLSRVLVAEQIYRANAILAGHPYHGRGA